MVEARARVAGVQRGVYRILSTRVVVVDCVAGRGGVSVERSICVAGIGRGRVGVLDRGVLRGVRGR